MSYVDAIYNSDTDKIQLCERVDGKRVLVEHKPKYEFYYDDLRNIFGERIDSIDRTIRVARRTALIELQQKTKARGGNAVVNLNFLLSPGGRVNLMAYGDAVILDKSKEE